MGKEVLKQFKQKLSILLVAAMLVGMMQPTVLDVQAAAPEDGIEAVTDEVVDEQVIDDASDVDAIESTVEEEPPLFDTGVEALEDNGGGTEPVDLAATPIILTHSVTGETGEGFTLTKQDITVTTVSDNDITVSGNTFTVVAAENYQIDSVAVKYTAEGKEETLTTAENGGLTAGENGTYTISEEILKGLSAATSFKVEVTASKIPVEAKTYTLSFNYTPAAGVQSVEVTGAEEAEGVYSVSENDTVTFTVSANDGYQIVSVKKTVGEAEAEVVTPEDGVYSLGAVTANTSVEIVTDKIEKEYTVKFASSEGYTISGEAKASVSENYTFTVSANDGYELDGKVVVTYQETEDSQAVEVMSFEPKENVWECTIPAAKLKELLGEGTLTIGAAAHKLATLTFTYDNSVSDNYLKVTVNGENKPETITGVSKKDKIVLNVESTSANNCFVDVKVGSAEPVEKTVAAGESIEIALDAISEDTTVVISAKKANVVSYQLDGESDSAIVKLGDKTLSSSEQLFYGTDVTELPLIVTMEDGYELVSVTGVPTDAVSANTSGEGYTVNPTKNNGNIKVTVKTSATELTEDKEIFFANKYSSLTYKVDTTKKGANSNGTKSLVTKSAVTPNAYVLDKEITNFVFTVTSAKPYSAVVTYRNSKGVPVELQPIGEPVSTNKDKSLLYTYSVPANKLPKDGIFTLEEVIKDKEVQVRYHKDEAEIVIARVGALVSPGTVSDNTVSVNGIDYNVVTYNVKEGQTLTLKVVAKEHCQITDASALKDKDLVKKPAASFEKSVKIDADTNITINSEGLYWAELQKDETALNAVKGVYTVTKDETYNVALYKGDRKPAKVAGLATAKAADAAKLTLSGNTLKPEAAAVGNQISVNVGSEDNAKAVVLKVKTIPNPKDVTAITITGPKNGVLEQNADTEKEYKIALTPKTAAINADTVKVSLSGNDAGTTAEITENGTLKITTANKVESGIKVVVSAGSGNSEFTLNSTNPWATVRPTVKALSSNDVSLTVTVGHAKNVVMPASESGKENVWYKVTATPIEGTFKEAADLPGTLSANDAKAKDTTPKTVYVLKDAESISQPATVQVFDVEQGKGAEQQYNVDVQLVKTSDGKEPAADGKNVVYESLTPAKLLKTATKKPYYEMNLKLTAGSKQIYTGQQNVKIATPKFSAKTTFKSIDPSLIEVKGSNGSSYNPFSFTVGEDGAIYASVNSRYETIGTYTITVLADAPDVTHASRASIKVNVVRGIYNLGVNLPSESIYKANNKAASLSPTVTYNYGYPSSVPKTKKITWTLEAVSTKPEVKANLEKLVTINKTNGKITVNKDYVVSNYVEENQFRVIAHAADYKDNNVIGRSEPITITDEAIAISEVVVARYDYTIGAYKVLARKGTKITAAELGGASLFALKKGTAETDTFKDEDIVSNSSLTFSSSNRNVVISQYGRISVNGVANNVTLTATAKDGSSQKASIKFNVVYKTVSGNLMLDIHHASNEYESPTVDDTPIYNSAKKWYEVHFSGTTGTTFELEVNDADGILTDYTNFSLTIAGAKDITQQGEKGDYNQNRKIVANSATATITLIDKSKKANQEGYKTVYKLINDSFAGLKAAPAVTLKEKENSKIYARRTAELVGTIALKGVSSFAGKYVRVEADLSAASAKTMSSYTNLASYMKNNNPWVIPVNEDGKTFNLNFYTYNTGSYKLKVTVGDVDTNGQFVPEYKAAVPTVKVVASPTTKNNVVLNASYTISPRSTDRIYIAAKKGYNYKCLELENALVDGKETEFAKYFTLGSYNDLEFQKGLKTEDYVAFEENYAKSGLAGYVKFNYYDGTKWQEGLLKLTVKAGANGAPEKYAAKAVTTITTLSNNSISANAIVPITRNGYGIDVAYAYAEDKETTGGFTVENYAVNGSVALAANAPAAKKHAVTLWVVPDSSCYLGTINEAANEEKAIEAIKAYGIQLTANVTVKSSDIKNKITVTAAAKKQSLKSERSCFYDPMTQTYRVFVPYTLAGGCKIESISSDKGFVEFSDNDFGSEICISVSKNGITNYSTNKDVKVTVKATVNFAADAQNVRSAETITFTLTMPKKTASYEETVKSVSQNEAPRIKDENPLVITRKMESDKIGQKLYKLSESIQRAVQSLPVMTWDNDTNVNVEFNLSSDYQAATATEAGKATFHVVLGNKSKGMNEDDYRYAEETVIDLVYDIPALGYTPKDFRTAIQEAVQAINAGETDIRVTNSLTKTDIEKVLREATGLNDSGKDFRLYLSSFDIDEADYGVDGSIKFTVSVIDLKHATDMLTVDGELTIAGLKTNEEVREAVKAAVTVSENSVSANDSLGNPIRKLAESNVEDSVKKNVLAVAYKAMGSNLGTVEFTKFEFTPAPYKGDGLGSVEYTLVVTDKDGNQIGAPIVQGKVEIAADAKFETPAMAIEEVDSYLGSTSGNDLVVKAVSENDTGDTVKAALISGIKSQITNQALDVELGDFALERATTRKAGTLSFKYTVKTSDDPAVSAVSKAYTFELPMKAQSLDEAKTAVEAAINAYKATNDTEDGDLQKDLTEEISVKYELAIESFNKKLATLKEQGKIDFKYVITDPSVSENGTVSENSTITIDYLPQSEEEALKAVEDAIKALFEEEDSLSLNTITQDDFTKAAKAAVEPGLRANTTFEVKTFERTQATVGNNGIITITYELTPSSTGVKIENQTISIEIAKLTDYASVETAAQVALYNFTASNSSTTEDIVAVVKNVLPEDASVTVSGNSLSMNAATVKEAGSITGTILIKLAGNDTVVSVKVEKEIAVLKDEASIKTALQKALEIAGETATTSDVVVNVVKDAFPNNAEITVSGNGDSLSVNDATATAPGSITGTISVKIGEIIVTESVNIMIPQLSGEAA